MQKLLLAIVAEQAGVSLNVSPLKTGFLVMWLTLTLLSWYTEKQQYRTVVKWYAEVAYGVNIFYSYPTIVPHMTYFGAFDQN